MATGQRNRVQRNTVMPKRHAAPSALTVRWRQVEVDANANRGSRLSHTRCRSRSRGELRRPSQTTDIRIGIFVLLPLRRSIARPLSCRELMMTTCLASARTRVAPEAGALPRSRSSVRETTAAFGEKHVERPHDV